MDYKLLDYMDDGSSQDKINVILLTKYALNNLDFSYKSCYIPFATRHKCIIY